jgi:ferritin
MIEEKLEVALADQMNQEFAAAYGYLAMAAWFDRESLDGFATWMQMQYREETMHGMKLFKYLLDRGGRPVMEGIEKPQMDFTSVLDVFETAQKQERMNTASINRLYELAGKLNDYATKSHLQWFLDEQVEEEKSIEDIIALLERASDDPSALLYLNDRMGERTDVTA